jgi:hypothetical protein
MERGPAHRGHKRSRASVLLPIAAAGLALGLLAAVIFGVADEIAWLFGRLLPGWPWR